MKNEFEVGDLIEVFDTNAYWYKVFDPGYIIKIDQESREVLVKFFNSLEVLWLNLDDENLRFF